MKNQTYYRFNIPSVINETLEGEAVIINLETGFYYSLDNIGAIVWEAFDNHLSVEEIIAGLSQKYVNEKQNIKSSVEALIEELKKENLLIAIPEKKSASAQPLYNVAENAPEIFVKPVLQKFGDMQDLLLLDPIHEVDERGWPHISPDNPMPPA